MKGGRLCRKTRKISALRSTQLVKSLDKKSPTAPAAHPDAQYTHTHRGERCTQPTYHFLAVCFFPPFFFISK